MDSDDILLDVEERMEKTVDRLKHSLAGIRTGRANPGLVDTLRVDAYGSPTPLRQLANVGAPEPTQIVIRPFDPSTIKDIEKAILASDLGYNPQSDGTLIRINVPPLSGEVRRKMVTRIKELAEEGKVSIRNIRRDGNHRNREMLKEKAISSDEEKLAEERLQQLTDEHIKIIGALIVQKEAEVLEV